MGGGPGSLRDDRINCLLEDRQGQLWIGTQSGLDLFNPETGRFTAIENPAINQFQREYHHCASGGPAGQSLAGDRG